ncbi:MAG: hypothetical protein QNK11_05730 [Legionella sp.]|nr:hypothetical protein [Legionella sp.]
MANSYCDAVTRQLSLCFNSLLCCCSRNSTLRVWGDSGLDTSQLIEESIFWQGFFAASSSMSQPAIIGEIVLDSDDIEIVHINQAAADFTGYTPSVYHDKDNSNGLIGRDVSLLMTAEDQRAHRIHVSNWLRRRRAQNPDSPASPTARFLPPKDIGRIELGRKGSPDQSENIEGVSRSIQLVTASKGVKQVNATLSFFSDQKEQEKIVGVFSFSPVSAIPVVQFGDLTVEMKVPVPDSENEDTKNHWMPRSSKEKEISVFINLPPSFAEFSDETKWNFKVINGEIDDLTKDRCKALIQNAFLTKLGEISLGSRLNLALVEESKIPLKKHDMQHIRWNLVQGINACASSDNMFMNIVTRTKQEKNREVHFSSFSSGSIDTEKTDVEQFKASLT